MSILIDEKTPIIVQGMTGDKGSFHTKEMVEYGTNVVGGVTPGKGGSKHPGPPPASPSWRLLSAPMPSWRRPMPASG
jgi:succinyl-CoA synthetase alpha subunit